jgi:hypothetical protein
MPQREGVPALLVKSVHGTPAYTRTGVKCSDTQVSVQNADANPGAPPWFLPEKTPIMVAHAA